MGSSLPQPDPRRPILCLVIDREATRGPLLDAVDASVRAGVDWIQIRDRELDGLRLLAHVRDVTNAARRAAKESGREVSILINRRVDLALVTGADGVHLGGDAMAPEDARGILGPQARIGASLHSAREVAAVPHGVDYVHLAPIFTPLSKRSQRPALGLAELERACTQPVPVLAQGGIAADTCAKAIGAGAAGVAVTGAVLMAADPGAAAASLRAALDSSV